MMEQLQFREASGTLTGPSSSFLQMMTHVLAVRASVPKQDQNQSNVRMDHARFKKCNGALPDPDEFGWNFWKNL